MSASPLCPGKAVSPFIPATETDTRDSLATAFASLVLLFACLSLTAAVSPVMAATPSQVLVLYNALWEERHPMLGPEQDSRRVAEHYVRMRTDPANGEKPYMLGLRCPSLKPARLKEWHLGERSGDNASGVVYRHASGQAMDAGEMRDGRLVEVALPETGAPWDVRTLSLDIEADSFPSRLALVREGRSLHPGLVVVQSQGDWHIRAMGSHFVRGGFTARASCSDSTGRTHSWTASYGDFRDVAVSATGADGLRDDQAYLDCFEEPIKAFLEDPANARPDGTLLKDHILYFVVCYGLPRTVAAPFGIATGITEFMRDFGTEIDFGQRLQIMYYDLETMRRNDVRPLRFELKKKSDSNVFADYLFRSELARPFYGPGINPFLHPDLYRKGKGRKAPASHRFSSSARNADPTRHLFFAMRIDGDDALSAMELVDRSVYASSFGGPAMGALQGIPLREDPVRTGGLDPGSPARLFWDAGYRHLFQHPRGWTRLELFRLAPGNGFFNPGDVFLPGGIATFVQSSQGWNKADSRFKNYLAQGVTITAGAARVAPKSTPHIHNRSFWDEDVLFPSLLAEYPIGEILLMNQIHLGWITSFVGDPLYSLPGKPRPPAALPELSWERDVRVRVWREETRGPGVMVMADLMASAAEPRLAQMLLMPDNAPSGQGGGHVFGRFSSRPHVFIPLDEAREQRVWRMELIDPFGNRAELRGQLVPVVSDEMGAAVFGEGAGITGNEPWSPLSGAQSARQ